MRVGALIIGSLAWDPSDLRRDWRETRLSMEAAQRVTAPIRYGRLSWSRGDTYTMVLSPSCIENGIGTGVGLAVPFRHEIGSAKDLIEEAVQLWRIESSKDGASPGALSAKWGSIALLLNPDWPRPPGLLTAWAGAVSCSPGYGGLPTAEGESRIVDASGLAQCPWPRVVESGRPAPLDALLVAATAADITNGRYPTSASVAEAWRDKPEEAKYFWRNRECGIETVHDEAVLRALESG